MWVYDREVNLIWLVFTFFIMFMAVGKLTLHLLSSRLPLMFVEAFNYGKALNGPVQTKLVRWISVPKHWFLHFYIFSSIYIPFLLYIAVKRYIWDEPVPQHVKFGLDFVCTTQRPVSSSGENVLFCLILLSIQCFRRLYECLFVNVKSNATMNLLHYIVGFAHYFCAGTGILCEASGFSNSPEESQEFQMVNLFSIKNLSLVPIFFYAWRYQLIVHKEFAMMKMRTNQNKHSIPDGDSFRLVSCPHYLCEVVIYIVFALVLGQHSTMMLTCVWVIINQVIAAHMSHTWYKQKFREYPKNRRAIIPYIF